MSAQIPADVITSFKMDPARHYMLFSGRELQTGMRVLVEDELARSVALYRLESDILRPKMLESARWCTVGRIELKSYPEHDEAGFHTGYNELISFEAIYDDGHVSKRTYNVSYAWYVERSVGEYAQIVRDGLREAFPDLILT